MLANASIMEQRPPPSSAHVCCYSRRDLRLVARRSGGGVPSLLRGTVARRFGWAGADRCGQSKGKRQKPGLEKAPQKCLAACSPRHLSFPSFPPLLGNPCLHLWAVLADWLDARECEGGRSACVWKGRECVTMNYDIYFTHSAYTPPRNLGSISPCF